MDYENRHCFCNEKIPNKERNYSYYMVHNKNKKENIINNYSTVPNNNDNNLVSANMRMSNMECRLNTMEKMMKYFDEFIHLKEEEKMNKLNSLEISSSIPSNINDLVFKVNKLENELNIIKKQKQMVEFENSKKIENLMNRIKLLENIISKNKLNIDIDIDRKDYEEKNKINFDYNNNNNNNNKLIRLNNTEQIDKDKYNKNTLEIDDLIQNKLNEIYSNNKISEILSLIEDINKIAEDNEFNINEQNENIRKIQNDNLTLIKIVSVHSEKLNNIDYILSELNNLKNKYFQILSLINNANNEKEEEIFTNEFIAKYKVDNNNNKNNQKENNDNNNNEGNINNENNNNI